MNLYELTTTPDTTHGVDWLSRYMIEHGDVPKPAEATVFVSGGLSSEPIEFHLPAVAEDGHRVKLCGPNIHKLHGKSIRVTVETVEGGAEERIRDMKERAPEAVIEMVDAWKRSRNRDGDSDYMAGMRAGWVYAIASLMGVEWKKVRLALEKGEELGLL